jgi:hypothetical protein
MGSFSPESIGEYCYKAYQIVVIIKLKGSLSRNSYMKDAIHSLEQLFLFKVSYANSFEGKYGYDEPDCYYGHYHTSPDYFNHIEPYATRFWYDLDHTA